MNICGVESIHSDERRSRRHLVRMAVGALLILSGILSNSSVQAQGPPAGVGRPVVLDGELEVTYEDADSGSRLLYFLQTLTDRIPLRFRGRGPDMQSGTRVRVSGDLAEGAVTTSSITTIAVSASQTFGDKSVLVILFNFSNNPTQPYTTLAAENINTQVRNFYLENSYQQTVMSFIVTGWHTIPATNATCDYNTWANQADTAATSAGFNVSSYARRVYAFPQTSACAWWGMGNVGGPRSWVNGTYAVRPVAHEQGHNFGNRHSHALQCDAAGCVSVEYGDDRDVLGVSGTVGHMNAFQKERLGWLNYGVSPVIQTVTGSNDYWIDNYELMTGNNKGLKIANPATGGHYYIESRQRVGFDANVAAGVVLHTGISSDSGSSYQVDLAPTATTWDSTLDVGQTFTDAALRVSVTTLSTSAEGALVRVTFDPLPCTTSAPAVALSPSAQSGTAGTTFQYTMSVTNTNSSGCGNSPFNFSATAPSGWNKSFSASSVASLSPGSSASTTLSLTPAAGASGTNAFQASAADAANGGVASASGSVTVITSLGVTASAVVGGGGKNRSATITVTAKGGSLPVSGAGVTVTITNPTGSATVLSATTDSTGVATVKYSLRNQPSGTYTAKAVAASGSTSGSTTISFFVP